MYRTDKIKFDMFEPTNLTDQLIQVTKSVYTKKIRKTNTNSIKFPVPTQIKIDLQLKAGDPVFFVKYVDGYYLSFKIKPDGIAQRNIRSRKLSVAGANNTLYIRIPQFISNTYTNLDFVEFTQIKGFAPYEWHLTFHTIEST